MKQLFTAVLALFIMTGSYAQVINVRYLKVDRGMEDKFIEGVKKKTKNCNSKEGHIRYFTFMINTGPHSGEFSRIRYEDELAAFDSDDAVGNAYWQELLGSIHTNTLSQRWSYGKEASNVTVSPFDKPLRRVITYNYQGEIEDKFWRFRLNVAKAIKSAGVDIFMEVWACASGCDGNTVNIVFGHKNYAELASDNNEEWTKVYEKYNELFGDKAYDEDIKDFESSLEMYGRSSYEMTFLPELSSPQSMSSLEKLDTGN